ncbi:hypothetical protein TNCV_4793131 [Trichonephila clavipes]|nr:hypothetical protein TNCV_4793131 [Trichonephila clavipes]
MTPAYCNASPISIVYSFLKFISPTFLHAHSQHPLRSLGTPVCSCHPIGPCIRNPAHHHQPCYNTKPNPVPDRGRGDLSYPSSLKNVASILTIDHTRSAPIGAPILGNPSIRGQPLQRYRVITSRRERSFLLRQISYCSMNEFTKSSHDLHSLLAPVSSGVRFEDC